MSNRFREAFEPVRATQQMKERTCDFLRDEFSKRQRKRLPALRYAAVCCTLLVIVVCGIGGYSFYQTPVSYISVDVNPSVELGLNRVNRVVTATAYNDDGAEVLQNLDLKYKPYTEAIELLLANETFAGYLVEDALLSFTVVSDKEEELLTGIQQCHGYAQAKTECHGANVQLVAEARYSGLSFGKYQAFLELWQYDKTITPEDCKGLSMRQIRDLTSGHQQGSDASMSGGSGNGHHRNGGCGGRHSGG